MKALVRRGIMAIFIALVGCQKTAPPHPLIGTWEFSPGAGSVSVGLPFKAGSVSLAQNTLVRLEFNPGGNGSFLLHSEGAIYDTTTVTAQIRWRTEGGNPPRRLLFEKFGQIRGSEDWNIELLNKNSLVVYDRSTDLRMVFRRTASP